MWQQNKLSEEEMRRFNEIDLQNFLMKGNFRQNLKRTRRQQRMRRFRKTPQAKLGCQGILSAWHYVN
jgi:hypothetical protein